MQRYITRRLLLAVATLIGVSWLIFNWLQVSHSTGLCGGGRPRSAKASRGENLQIEEPVVCRYAPAFHFHTTLARVLGPTLIGDQVVQVRLPYEKRLLAPTWVMKAFHGE